MPNPAIKRFVLSTATLVLAALALAGYARAQGQSPAGSAPDLSGTYQCKPNPDPCTWSGASASISQNGNKLTIKGTDGALADATLTSPTTISAGATFNSLGVVRPNHAIDWSDGTRWSKQ